MARTEVERTAQQSVLDRLMDADPRTPADPPMTWMQSVRQLKASVRRDLEWLLNTRRVKDAPPAGTEELRTSVYRYGLPDISSLSRDSMQDRIALLADVEHTIAVFEPRLADVRVSLVEQEVASEKFRRELRFLIEGLLRMDPSPERVVFDTVLEFTSGEYEVKGADGA